MSPDVWLKLKLCLRPGSVFYFQHRDLSSGEPHYFVVMNREPLRTGLLLMTVATSKVESARHRRRLIPGTVIEISPAEYGEFSVLSAFDCNELFERSIQELAELMSRGQVRYHADLPSALFEKLKTAVLLSPIVEDELKESL
jgi:hypothetical protein